MQDAAEDLNTSNAGNTTMESLISDIRELRIMVQAQQATIRRLESEGAGGPSPAPRMGVQTIKLLRFRYTPANGMKRLQ